MRCGEDCNALAVLIVLTGAPSHSSLPLKGYNRAFRAAFTGTCLGFRWVSGDNAAFCFSFAPCFPQRFSILCSMPFQHLPQACSTRALFPPPHIA